MAPLGCDVDICTGQFLRIETNESLHRRAAIESLYLQPMPRISPHFVCPALLQDALRYTFACRKFTPTPTAFRVRLYTPRRRLCTQASPLIDDEMGKEDKSKNFTLKVPKGTRDCEFYFPFFLAPLSVSVRKCIC